jgi:UDPglucose 6-dehydrogenase
MKIGIVGYGVVGRAIAACFSSNRQNEIAVYDKFVSPFGTGDHKRQVNTCDLAFVCVPTPAGADGMSGDTSAVEEAVDWITVPVCIKSTVIPGTVDRLTTKTRTPIAFSPEYIGESPGHPWKVSGAYGFVIVGGEPHTCDLIIEAYKSCLGTEARYYRTDARTAELCKYMENCFLATKVAFVNQFFDIARAFRVDFNELRELWLADPRIGESHTRVTEERGFAGPCIPKDVNALIAAARPLVGVPLLEAVVAYNKIARGTSGQGANKK